MMRSNSRAPRRLARGSPRGVGQGHQRPSIQAVKMAAKGPARCLHPESDELRNTLQPIRGDGSEDHLIDDGDSVVSWSLSIEARTWSQGPAILNRHIFKAVEFPALTDKRFLFFLLEATTTELRLAATAGTPRASCIHRLETDPVIVEEQRFCQSD